MDITSFINTYKIKNTDLEKFCNIMSDTRKIRIGKVKGHEDVREKEGIKNFLKFLNR